MERNEPRFGVLNETKTTLGNELRWEVRIEEHAKVITLYVLDHEGDAVYPSLTVDDAEAIGYSLLYAAELQRAEETKREEGADE